MKIKRWLAGSLAGATALILTGCIVVHDHPPRGGVVVMEAPPAAQVEVIPVAPSPNHVWIEGYWVWRNRWVWEPGRYVIRPHAHAVWVRGHWDHGHHGWVYVEGRWR